MRKETAERFTILNEKIQMKNMKARVDRRMKCMSKQNLKKKIMSEKIRTPVQTH